MDESFLFEVPAGGICKQFRFLRELTMTRDNLFNEEAIQKLKKLAEGIHFAMFATALDSRPMHVVPMSTKKVDEEGNIWFLSGRDSSHNQNIEAANDVHLIYCDVGSMQFLNVFGQAEISTQKTVLRELYEKSDDAWFQGADDPNLSAIKVQPQEAFYWDSKNNRLITLFKIGVSSFTGNQPNVLDLGELQF
jgi:general stress protein 26